jgi:regulator of sigma E protease
MAEREGLLKSGVLESLNFAAILSINLAIVNVLPIPALDGGRAVFLGLEAIMRRRVKPEWEQRVNTVGFAALLMLLVLVSVRDVLMVAGDVNVQNWFKGFLGQ